MSKTSSISFGIAATFAMVAVVLHVLTETDRTRHDGSDSAPLIEGNEAEEYDDGRAGIRPVGESHADWRADQLPEVRRAPSERNDAPAPPASVRSDEAEDGGMPEPSRTAASSSRLSLPIPAVRSAGAHREAAQVATPAPDRDRIELDQRWEVETPDPAWTSGTQDYTVMALVDAKVPVDRLLSVDCRTTLCRLDLRFASAHEAVSLYDLRQPDFELRFFRDGQNYTVYMAREGEKMPVSSAADDQEAIEAESPPPSSAFQGASRFARQEPVADSTEPTIRVRTPE